MNLLIFTLEKHYIKIALAVLVTVNLAAWEIDLSRRVKDLERTPASIENPTMTVEAPKVLKNFFPSSASHEVVILNTEKGFVPSKIQVKKGQRYTFHIVNVNEAQKNISFILDSHAQHFGTFFGKPKTFVLNPKKEGIYTFVSPEVAAEGRIVVVSDKMEAIDIRKPASTGK